MFIRRFQKNNRAIFNCFWGWCCCSIIFTSMALGNSGSWYYDDIWLYLVILLGGKGMKIVVLKPKGFMRFVLKTFFKV